MVVMLVLLMLVLLIFSPCSFFFLIFFLAVAVAATVTAAVVDVAVVVVDVPVADANTVAVVGPAPLWYASAACFCVSSPSYKIETAISLCGCRGVKFYESISQCTSFSPRSLLLLLLSMFSFSLRAVCPFVMPAAENPSEDVVKMLDNFAESRCSCSSVSAAL